MKAILRILSALLVCFGINVPTQSGVPEKAASEGLRVTDVLNLRKLSSRGHPTISPNGQFVAYSIEYRTSDDKSDGARLEVWLVNVDTKMAMKVSEDCMSCWWPSWSPDGQSLAFYDREKSGVSLRVWSVQSNTSRRIATGIVVAQYPAISWSPDGRYIFAETIGASQSTQDSSSEQTDIVEYHGTEEPNPSRAADVSIVAIDSRTSAIDTIVHGRNLTSPFPGFSPSLSPKGKFIALLENGRSDKSSLGSFADIAIVSVGTRSLRTVMRDVRNPACLSWSPNGDEFAVASLSFGREGSVSYFVVNAETGSVRTLMVDPHRPTTVSLTPLWVSPQQVAIVGADYHRLWIANTDGRSPDQVYANDSGVIMRVIANSSQSEAWHPKTDALAILVRRDTDMELVPTWINYNTHSSVAMPALQRFVSDTSWLTREDFSAKRNIAVVTFEDADHPPDLWSLEADGSLKRLTALNPQIDDKKFGTVQLLQWIGPDDLTHRALLILPTNYVAGRKYPTIVTQYGGWFPSERRFQFGVLGIDQINQQVYSAMGFVVLLPDITLRVARESIYLHAIEVDDPRIMQDIAVQMNAAVDAAIQNGYVDADRLGIIGHSFGGYGVLSTIVKTGRFKAAICRSGGQLDWISHAGLFTRGTGIYAPISDEILGASLWQDRTRYIENSPLFFLTEISTPLLLTVGTKDYGAAQSEEIYIGMRRLGKPASLVEYAGEGHVESGWSFGHQLDLYRRITRFFEDHLLKDKTP